MDNFLYPSFLNPSPNKLIKAASFSELSTTRKVIEHSTEDNGNLIKQYSCEKIYDKKSSTREVRISHIYKSDNEEDKVTWMKAFSTSLSEKMSDCSLKDNTDKTAFVEENYSSKNQNNKTLSNRSSKSILAPAKLVIGRSKSELSNTNDSKCFINDTASVDNEDDKSVISFKVPLPPVKKFNKKTNIVKNEKLTEERVTKNDMNKLTEEDTADTFELNERLKNLVGEEPKKIKNLIRFCWLFLINRWLYKSTVLFSILAVCLAYVFNTANLTQKFCDPRFEFREISQDLRNHIYNQESVIDEFTEYFRDKHNKTGFHVIALIGGIGVGKSYTTEIIKNSMKATSNVVDVFPPLINKEDESYASLSMCRCNLIRLENLKTDDIPDAAMFADKLKNRTQNYCVLIIALFNTQEADEHLKKTFDLNKSTSLIKQAFGERKLEPTLLSYRPMSKDALIKCIKDAADYSNVKLSNTEEDNILHDLLIADNGCKGVYAKVQLRSSSKL